MTKIDANAVANALGGDAHQMQHGDWVVKLRGHEERVVVIFDKFICEFEDEEYFNELNATVTLAIY